MSSTNVPSDISLVVLVEIVLCHSTSFDVLPFYIAEVQCGSACHFSKFLEVPPGDQNYIFCCQSGSMITASGYSFRKFMINHSQQCTLHSHLYFTTVHLLRMHSLSFQRSPVIHRRSVCNHTHRHTTWTAISTHGNVRFYGKYWL